jgi:predicted hydrocarbon binding protein
MSEITRPTLGSFMHMICFQYLRVVTEDVAGRAPIISAGRTRGYELVESLGLANSTKDADTIREKLDAALGENGTRLCLVKKVLAKDNGGYEVHIAESACTAGQKTDQPLCAFTLGAFIGAIHALTGTRMLGTETSCAACGNDECIYQIDPI